MKLGRPRNLANSVIINSFDQFRSCFVDGNGNLIIPHVKDEVYTRVALELQKTNILRTPGALNQFCLRYSSELETLFNVTKNKT